LGLRPGAAQESRPPARFPEAGSGAGAIRAWRLPATRIAPGGYLMIDPSRRLKPAAFQAQEDYNCARRKVFLDEISSFLMRRPNDLLSFQEVREQLPIKSQVYRGVRAIPVARIIGSVDRYEDFNRHFLPTQTHTQARWENVDEATLTDIVLPPIQVYQIGEAYFVLVGNHRVSVAKEQGMAFIDAQVVELQTKLPLTRDTDQRELLRLAEYARFLEQTNLDTLRPGAGIAFTSLGRYNVLIEHISAHRWFMGIEQNRPVSWEEAVLDWYDTVYAPLVQIIEEQGILDAFPGRTPADLYLWIMDHRYYLSQEQGRQVGPRTAVLTYNRSQVNWARKVLGWTNRLLDHVAHPFVISAQALARALKAGSARR
jgi:hypothetical protein